MAKIRHLFVSPGHNFFGHHGKPAGEHGIVEVEEIECLAGRGIRGDRFLDHKEDYKGQITFFDQATYESLCEQFQVAGTGPEVFRRNVIVEGQDLNEWIGETFELQGVRFLGTEEARPCYWMNQAFAEGAEEAMRGRGGLRAKILSDGTLRVDG